MTIKDPEFEEMIGNVTEDILIILRRYDPSVGIAGMCGGLAMIGYDCYGLTKEQSKKMAGDIADIVKIYAKAARSLRQAGDA